VQRAVGHLKGLQDPAGGLFRGSPAGRFGAPSPEMTAVAVAALQRLGHGRSPEVRRGLASVARIGTRGDAPDAPEWRLAARERATVALHNAGGRDWARWRDALVPELLAAQSANGAWAAAAGPEQPLGPAYATAQATLALAACYRYPPTDAALAAAPAPAWAAILALAHVGP